MTATVIRKSWLYSGVFSFLLAGFFLGGSIVMMISVSVISAEFPATQYPGLRESLLFATNYAWAGILIGVIFIAVGIFELNHGMKTQVTAEPKSGRKTSLWPPSPMAKEPVRSYKPLDLPLFYARAHKSLN